MALMLILRESLQTQQAQTARQEAQLEVVEMRMQRFFFRVTRTDRVKNKQIRGAAHVRRLGNELRETSLR